MVRFLLSISIVGLVAACSGDGRGSQYSSARAQSDIPTYIPVTPGATPITGIESASTIAPATVVRPTARGSAVPASAAVTRFATGPIFDACQSSGRDAASRSRCGCVQWVANQELTAAQQKRGADFFSDQHGLQNLRQTSESNKANGDFWRAWKAYGESAGAQCKRA